MNNCERLAISTGRSAKPLSMRVLCLMRATQQGWIRLSTAHDPVCSDLFVAGRWPGPRRPAETFSLQRAKGVSQRRRYRLGSRPGPRDGYPAFAGDSASKRWVKASFSGDGGSR